VLALQPLTEVVQTQPTFEFTNVTGTIAGYHLHFITGIAGVAGTSWT
jgi:alpha-acetolactate decarboxylase